MNSFFRLLVPIILIASCYFLSYIVNLNDQFFSKYFFSTTPSYLDVFFRTMIFIFVALFITRFSTIFLFGFMFNKRLNIILPKFLMQLYDVFVFIFFIIIILNTIYNVPLTGLLAAASAIGVGLAFGLKDLISDIFAGIAINIEKPFLLNDHIELDNGLKGIVFDITWKATYLRTQYETVVGVPNHKITSMILTNYHKPNKYYQLRDDFHLSYSVPIPKAKRIILSVLESENIDFDSQRVSVHIIGIDNLGVNYSVIYYCSNILMERHIRSILLSKIIEKLKEANIEPVYNKIDLITKNDKNDNYIINKIDFLKNIELFKTLDEELLLRLSSNLNETFYKENTEIVKEGDDKNKSLFIIVEGLVEVIKKDEKSYEDILITRLSSGDYFGEFSLLTGNPRSASVFTKTEVILYEITYDDIQSILLESNEFVQYLSSTLALRELRNIEKVEQFCSLSFDDRNRIQINILHKIRSIFNLK